MEVGKKCWHVRLANCIKSDFAQHFVPIFYLFFITGNT